MNVSDMCAICRVKMTKRALIKLSPCNHLFHKTCWDQHAEVRIPQECCLCREPFTSTVDFNRRTNQMASGEARRIVVQAAGDLHNWKYLAQTLGIKYKTAWSWVKSGDPVGRSRKNTLRKALTEEEIDGLIAYIETDPALTLQQLADYVQATYNQRLSCTTIARYLHGRVFSYKGNHYEPKDMNSEAKKDLRMAYIQRLLQLMAEGKPIQKYIMTLTNRDKNHSTSQSR